MLCLTADGQEWKLCISRHESTSLSLMTDYWEADRIGDKDSVTARPVNVSRMQCLVDGSKQSEQGPMFSDKTVFFHILRGVRRRHSSLPLYTVRSSGKFPLPWWLNDLWEAVRQWHSDVDVHHFQFLRLFFYTLSVSLRGHELDNLLFLTKGFPLFLVSGKGLLHPAYGTMAFSRVHHCMLLSNLKQAEVVTVFDWAPLLEDVWNNQGIILRILSLFIRYTMKPSRWWLD